MEVPFYTSLKLEHALQKLNEMFIPTTIMYTIYIYHFTLQTCGFAVFFRPHESQQVFVSGMYFHSQNKGDTM
jgi:hypothetical protein